MEFPFGHRHHNRREEEEEEERRRREEPHYPAPGHHQPYGGRPEQHGPPFPSQHGVGGGHHAVSYPGRGYPAVQHVAHEVTPDPYGRVEGSGGSHGGWQAGHHGGAIPHHGGSGGGVANQRTVRVFTKAEENYSLSIRDGKVILARANPADEYQHWIKDEKFSTKVKDEEGLPCFALVNKVTGEAIKHSIGATHPVRLVPYNPDHLDESILWTESYDTGENFRCIRMVNNIRLNFDAFHGDKDHGGVRDGTIVVLWEWLKGENQRWKIVPY